MEQDGEIDTKRYAKIEKIPGGTIEESRVLNGVMFNKDVTHPKMKRRLENPRILLIDCNLEYKKGESQTNVEITDTLSSDQVIVPGSFSYPSVFDIDETGGGPWRIKWRPAAPQRPPPGVCAAAAVAPVTSAAPSASADFGAPSASAASGAPPDAQEETSGIARIFNPCAAFPDGGGDRADLSDFWRVGPGRNWSRPS